MRGKQKQRDKKGDRNKGKEQRDTRRDRQRNMSRKRGVWGLLHVFPPAILLCLQLKQLLISPATEKNMHALYTHISTDTSAVEHTQTHTHSFPSISLLS